MCVNHGGVLIKAKAIKALFTNSLTELLKTKQIQNISVREISEGCGLSSRSFYNHFADKNDLVKYSYLILNEEAWFENGKLCNLERALERWGNQVLNNFSFFSNTYCYTGQNNIRDAVMEKGCHDLARLLENNGHEDLLKDPMCLELIRFYMSGLATMLEHEVMYPKSKSPWSNVDNYLFYLPQKLYRILIDPPITTEATPTHG